MVNALVKQYTELIKKDWSELLARQDYNDIEEDLTSDGQWHGEYPNEFRDLGKVAFWKKDRKHLMDGIIIQEVKFYGDDGHTVHGTGVYLTYPQANIYFNRLFKKKWLLEEEGKSLSKKILTTLLGLKRNRLDRCEKAWWDKGRDDKVIINSREFDSFHLYNSIEFYEFLKNLQDNTI